MSELDYWNGRLIKGAISRREFMGRAAALGASSLAISTMLASAGAAAADTPKSGGVLKLGLAGGSTTDSLDFRTTTDSVMIDCNHGIWNCLAEWGQDGKPHPELAESWEATNGAKGWVLNLRKGVTFSNGKEFNADDAIYSLNLHRGDTKSGGATSVKGVTDIKKLNDHQIQVSLSSPDADFPYGLTDYHLMMVPDGFKDWAKPVGTGAFVLENFDPGVRIRVKKVRPYWKEGKGLLDGVDVTVINDGSARLNALISGQIDAINRVDHKAVALLSKTPRIEVVRAPGGWFSILAMEVDKPPYNNPDIRMALMLAADREQMLKALFSGYGTAGNDHPIPPTDPYFNKELPQRKYDPEKAAFHFKKAGIADPKIILQASDAAFNGAVDQASLLQASAVESRNQGRREEGTGRRLLRQRLAESAFRQQLLGRTAGGDADALRRLPGERALERDALERPAIREAACRRQGGNRRGQAQTLYLGDAGHSQRARRGAHPRVPRLARRA